MPFHIIRNDITGVTADVIVNTANPKPIASTGIDGAIYKAAGEKKLLEERNKIGDIAPGQCAVTPAFALNAKYIIHTVGPVWEGGQKGEFEILSSCYRNSLETAEKLGCSSIAFPLLATGVYGFPKDKALDIAIKMIDEFLEDREMEVTLVVFDPDSYKLSGELVENVRRYVDANYVEQQLEAEYFACEEECEPCMSMRDDSVRFRRKSSEKKQLRAKENCEPVFAAPRMASMAVHPDKIPSIDELLHHQEKTFQEKLFEIIDERGLTGPQVYNHYISKQVYSKIQSNPDYHPTKYTAIALCLSLHLSVEETLDLIGRAGWTLSPSSRADLIVKGCILHKEYNVVKINLILFDFDCPELEKIK